MKDFIQQLVYGLGVGGQYALWAVGYGLVYQVLGLMHFAHGDTLIFGVFVAWALLTIGTPFALAVVIAMAVAALLAVVIERTVYRPLVRRNQVFLAFVGALGAAFVLRNVVTMIWGVDTHVFPGGLLPTFTLDVAGVQIPGVAVMNLGVALGAVALFQLYLKHARNGQAILAVAQSRETAALMGIPVGRIIALVYALSGALGLLGAMLYVADAQAVTVALGFTITLKAFIAAIIGGIRSIRGAVVGGLVLGVLETMIAGYVSTLLLNAIVFSVLMALLLFMPYGILGRKVTARV